MEIFAKIVNPLSASVALIVNPLLKTFHKSSILDVWQGFVYASDICL